MYVFFSICRLLIEILFTYSPIFSQHIQIEQYRRGLIRLRQRFVYIYIFFMKITLIPLHVNSLGNPCKIKKTQIKYSLANLNQTNQHHLITNSWKKNRLFFFFFLSISILSPALKCTSWFVGRTLESCPDFS